MRFAAVVLALAALAACEKPAHERQQASANTATNASDIASSTVAAAAKPLPKDAALKLMHDRHENMEKIGDATKAASRTLKSGSPDLAVIRSSAATIAGLSPKVPSWFPAGTGPDVGDTEAKAEIWQKPQDFPAKSRAFEQAPLAFDAAAKAGEMPAIQARFADLGKSCKGCHDLYREDDD